MDEITTLYNSFGINYFSIEDNNFTFYKQRVLDICNGIIKRGLKIQFDTRNDLMVKTLDCEIIDALVEAGLLWAYLAIESGSPYIRNKIIGKDLSNDKIYSVVKDFRRHPHVHLFGFLCLACPKRQRRLWKKRIL